MVSPVLKLVDMRVCIIFFLTLLEHVMFAGTNHKKFLPFMGL